jgi:hypothetical protein
MQESGSVSVVVDWIFVGILVLSIETGDCDPEDKETKEKLLSTQLEVTSSSPKADAARDSVASECCLDSLNLPNANWDSVASDRCLEVRNLPGISEISAGL